MATDNAEVDKRAGCDETLTRIGQLAAGLAHEINNPLTSIKGFVSLLSSAPAEKREHYLYILNHEIMRIEQVTSELLALAPAHTNACKNTNLTETMMRAVATLKDYARDCGVTYAMDLRTVPTIVCADLEMERVFINVIKNAIEAMPGGGLVSLSLALEGAHITVKVHDEGVGLSEDLMALVGTPFFTTKRDGYGLGLLICRRVISEYGGVLTMDSGAGQGTTVTVKLPVSGEA